MLGKLHLVGSIGEKYQLDKYIVDLRRKVSESNEGG